MNDLAMMHYLVEHIESNRITQTRAMLWRAAAPGPMWPIGLPTAPAPDRPLVLAQEDAETVRRNSNADIVRVLDREKKVIWWREHRNREAAVKLYSEMMDDLMKLEVGAFRRKYAIIPDRPPGTAAVSPDGSDSSDIGAWRDRIARSEGGAASQETLDWGNWGQR